MCRSQWPRGLRSGSAGARLLGLRVRIPPRARMSVCFECCVLSGRGLCDGLITRLKESYRLWCVVVCDLETSRMRRPWPTGGCCAKKKKKINVTESFYVINPLTPNDSCGGRTAPLTSKSCILYIYSTNTGTEYFKHGI